MVLIVSVFRSVLGVEDGLNTTAGLCKHNKKFSSIQCICESNPNVATHVSKLGLK
jgi:hypothetical protein